MSIQCEWRAITVRHSSVDDICHATNFKRTTVTTARQSGDLRSEWNAPRDRSYADSGHRDVMLMNIDFPFQFDARKRTASTGDDDHIRDLIEQLVLTGPGERVNRPTFGSGLQQLAFAPSSPEVAAAVQFLVQGALEQYMGDLIQVESVEVDAVDSALQVRISYAVKRTLARSNVQFSTGA